MCRSEKQGPHSCEGSSTTSKSQSSATTEETGSQKGVKWHAKDTYIFDGDELALESLSTEREAFIFEEDVSKDLGTKTDDGCEDESFTEMETEGTEKDMFKGGHIEIIIHEGSAGVDEESAQASTDQYRVPFVSFEEKTLLVGPPGETFKVGGCTVHFPPFCFKKFQKVTVSAKINPKEWPPGKVAIAPCLNVEAKNLKKKAMITFTSWRVRDDEGDSLVEIMHYNEQIKKWEVIGTRELDSSRLITFECKSFSPIVPVVANPFDATYAMASRVYMFRQNFTVAVMLNQKLIIESCSKIVKDNLRIRSTRQKGFGGWLRNIRKYIFGSEGLNVRIFAMDNFTCKADYEVYSNLFCWGPSKGLTFCGRYRCGGGQCNCGQYKHNVKDAIALEQPTFTTLTLQGCQDGGWIDLRCEITRIVDTETDIVAKHDIRHYCQPVEMCDSLPNASTNSFTPPSPQKLSPTGEKKAVPQNPMSNPPVSTQEIPPTVTPDGIQASGAVMESLHDSLTALSESIASNSSHEGTTECDASTHGQPCKEIVPKFTDGITDLAQTFASAIDAQGNTSGSGNTYVQMNVDTLNVATNGGSNTLHSQQTTGVLNKGKADFHKENCEEHIRSENTSHIQPCKPGTSKETNH